MLERFDSCRGDLYNIKLPMRTTFPIVYMSYICPIYMYICPVCGENYIGFLENHVSLTRNRTFCGDFLEPI